MDFTDLISHDFVRQTSKFRRNLSLSNTKKAYEDDSTTQLYKTPPDFGIETHSTWEVADDLAFWLTRFPFQSISRICSKGSFESFHSMTDAQSAATSPETGLIHCLLQARLVLSSRRLEKQERNTMSLRLSLLPVCRAPKLRPIAILIVGPACSKVYI